MYAIRSYYELIEYWELQPAVRLNEAGLRIALRLESGQGDG